MLKIALLDCAINKECCSFDGGQGICSHFFFPYVISTIDLNLTLLLITRKHVRVYWMSCKNVFFSCSTTFETCDFFFSG